MPDCKTKKIPHDAKRVSLTDPDEVRYWCGKFDCTEDVLRRAVRKVGDSAAKVECEVRRIKGLSRRLRSQ